MTDDRDDDLLGDVRLSFGEHLEELRSRIIYSLLAVGACFFVCYAFKSTLFDVVMRPHRLAMLKLGLVPQLKVIRYQEGFITLLKISLLASMLAASPIIIYHIWRFVWPGLRRAERRYVKVFAPISVGSFFAGVLFGYFCLIPFGLQFLLSVLGPSVQPNITMGTYVNLVALLTLILGLVFELPLVMLFMSKIGLFTAEAYAEHRKPAILLAFILGAVLTPPDPFTQLMMAVPMVGLYELGILVSGPTRANFIRFGKLLGVAAVLLVALAVWGRMSRSAELYASQGQVHVSSAMMFGGGSAQSPTRRLGPHAVVTTGADGRAALRMADGSRVKLNANTAVQVLGRSQLRLVQGEVFVQLPAQDAKFLVHTPNGDVTGRGGAFDVIATADQTAVTVASGAAEIRRGDTRKSISAGHRDVLATGGAAVDVGKAVGWTRGWGEAGP